MEGFDVNVLRGVDRGDAQWRVFDVGEAMSPHRGGDEDVSRDRRQSVLVDLEAALSGLDDKHLRVGVAVLADARVAFGFSSPLGDVSPGKLKM